MRIIGLFLFVFLSHRASSQETETESSTEFTVSGQNTVTANDVYFRRKSGRLLPQSSLQYRPVYGTRMTEATVTPTTARFNTESNEFAGVPLKNEVIQQTQDSMQYPPANGMYRFSMYYPQPLDPRDSYQYQVPLENNFSRNKFPIVEDSDNANLTSRYISLQPGFSAAQIYRQEQYPVSFGLTQNDEVLLRNEPSVVNVGDPVSLLPYYFSAYPFSAPALPSRSDDNELDLFVRPSYFDREPGIDTVENTPLRKELPKDLPIVEQKEEFPTFADAAAPAENIQTRLISRRPLTPVDFPLGIPPPEILTPFAYPQGPVSPLIPPIPPAFAAPANENLLTSVLDQPQSQTSNVEPIPDDLAPVDNDASDVTRVISNEDYNNNEIKLPFEFGYEMNDGMGTDQHRREVSDGNGKVTGSYGYRDLFGLYRIVNYVADENGFRVFIHSNEPGMANPGSADAAVVAEVPPPKAIADGLRTLKVDAVEVSNEPLELEAAAVVENK